MFLGSCLCGAVKYTIQMEQLDDITLCHCHNCQKASGSAFNAITPVAAEHFQVEDEQSVLKHYESSPGVERHFCGQCGSPLFSFRPATQQYRVRIGSLDDSINFKPAQHIYFAYRAPWLSINDIAPKYPEGL